MGSRINQQTKIIGILGSFGLLTAVGYMDYVTGYEISLMMFYLIPILFALRYAGMGFAFALAVLSAFVCLFADIAAGKHYSDYLTPIWNTAIRMSVFLLVVILFSNRNFLKQQVDQKTEKLRQELRERTRLEKELLEIAESEQRRIAHDLHDSLGQHLTATALAGKVLAKRLDGKAMVDSTLVDRLVDMVEEAIDLTRNLVRSLHPIELGADGLHDALEHLAANLSKAFVFSCRFHQSGTVILPDPKAAIHLYRIAQEAASNAVRHGHARNVAISLDATSKSLMLSITDDGIGLQNNTPIKSGMGLRIMKYRADLIGAMFDIQNLPAGGARAICILNSSPTNAGNNADEN